MTILPMYPWTAMLVWHPHLSPLACGVLIIALVGWSLLLHRRMRTRMSRRKAWVLGIPKALALLLLIIALLDPAWSTSLEQRPADSSVLVLLDRSSSMDVIDDGKDARLARAERAVEQLEASVPRHLSLDLRAFDAELRDGDAGPATNALRGTDIAGALVSLTGESDLSSYAAVVLFTDGGDEPVQTAALPPVPLHVVAVGTDASQWHDVAVASVEFPATVEEGTEFEVRADLRGHVRSVAALAEPLRVVLEREKDGEWGTEAEQQVDLSNLRARVTFRTTCEEAFLQKHRVVVAGIEGELSELNNRRTFAVDVNRKALHVLFYTREVGTGLKMIRSDLASDPGITFTALFRTIGERFTIQGERLEGDDSLEAGFPEDPEVLGLFDCVVLGSFPASEWRPAQVEALVTFVQEGGAVIFMGGEHSFGRGGYAGTPLADLLPWAVSDAEPDMERGRLPVTVPTSAADNPIIYGLGERLLEDGAPALEAVNVTGGLKPGAVSLMNAVLQQRSVPVVALQRFGNGRTLSIASNTMWKWARGSAALRAAHSLFWRQAVRHLCGSVEGGRLLSVRWDRPGYRPGEQASAEIRILGGQQRSELELRAMLSVDGESSRLPVEPLEGQRNASVIRMVFTQRGTYRFRLVAYEGENAVETYEKSLFIAPRLDEGANLEVDEPFLRELAERGGGLFVRETGIDELAERLAERNQGRMIVSETSLVHGSPVFFILFLLVLVAEWTIRRWMNLF